MNAFLEKVRLVFADKVLRRRVLITLALLAVFRLLAAIPVPGVETSQLNSFFSGNQLLGLLNIFTGGGLSRLSLVMLGVGPYITASIIMQLMTLISPRLKSMYQEEGEYGRKKFGQYSRMLTVPLALIQGWSYLILLQRSGVIGALTPFETIRNLAMISAGSIFLVWIGERISEFGVGNGSSLIIFAGIVATLPTAIVQFVYTYLYPTFDPTIVPTLLGLVIGVLIVIYAVVIITEAERPIPVTYAKRVRGNKIYGGVSTYIPLRLNQAGVIPIIFALSILLFPSVIFQFLATRFSAHATLVSVSNWIVSVMNPSGWIYGVLYFILVFAFTYFYTAVTFDPNLISENLQKNGAFIPGVRPGQSTAMSVSRILTRLTAFGALFLGLIAILPLIVRALTNITAFTIGGTALLIVVSVVIDLVKKTEAQISMKEY
jgi:preprotein translocase subunit SecY